MVRDFESMSIWTMPRSAHIVICIVWVAFSNLRTAKAKRTLLAENIIIANDTVNMAVSRIILPPPMIPIGL